MEILEKRVYECPSMNHSVVGHHEELENLNYLKGNSNYYFCKPCGTLYTLEKGKLLYFDEDVDMLPALLMKDGTVFDSNLILEGDLD